MSTTSKRPASLQDRPWIGSSFDNKRILVLGESWYGDWGDDRNTDAGYVRAYLRGALRDGMYTKMAKGSGLSVADFWNSIAFTNFVVWTGTRREDRPTAQMYRDSVPRLKELLGSLAPLGVWILGKEQGRYSAPVVHEAGIPFDVATHPTGYGVTLLELKQSWERLMKIVG